MISLLGARIYWGQDHHYMGDFELGARLLTYGGILSTFGGVIINNIFRSIQTLSEFPPIDCLKVYAFARGGVK